MAVLCKQLVCARSDGQTRIKDGSQWKLNEPDKQNPKPKKNGELDYYEKLNDDDPTSLDWRKKLGGMLAVGCGIKDKHGSLGYTYILKTLPEGYQLWKHHRTTVENGKTVATRQDTYLYGYPGSKSRFRSAQEFLPHLLWLMTDSQGDSFHNCSCRFCFEEAKPLTRPKKATAKVETQEEKTKNNKETKSTSATGSSSTQQSTKTKTAANSTTSSTQQQYKPTQAPQPSTLNQQKSKQAAVAQTSSSADMQQWNKIDEGFGVTGAVEEQQRDLAPSNTYIYRPGELVWYNKNPAWGLALVLARKRQNNACYFLLQPLSHPYAPALQVVRSNTANDLRPWLAWSVPPISFAEIKDMPFDRIPWDRIVNGEFGDAAKNTVEVDAAIIGARTINSSYTPFAQDLSRSTSTVLHYNGLYLGGERMWVGEAVRIMGETPDEIRIMIVKSFVEDLQPDLFFMGSVFVYMFQPMNPRLRKYKDFPSNFGLPARVSEDTLFRNTCAADYPHNSDYGKWQLVTESSTISWKSVKGRWYESKLLMPILRGQAEFNADVSKGAVGDVGSSMNARTHMMGEKGNKRYLERLEAASLAVPQGCRYLPFGEGGFEVPQHILFPN